MSPSEYQKRFFRERASNKMKFYKAHFKGSRRLVFQIWLTENCGLVVSRSKDHVMNIFEEVNNEDCVTVLHIPFRFSFILVTTVTHFSVKILTTLTMNIMYW